MVNDLLVILPISLLGWVLYSAYCLALNYQIARIVGVPLVVIPISPENVLWIIAGNYLIPLFKRLPFGNGTFTRFNRHGWQTSDNGKAHLELGDAFITVTPGKNWLYVCNAEALTDIFRRGSDFPRNLETIGKTSPASLHNIDFTSCRVNLVMPEMLNVFGPNVSTVSQSQ